MNRDWLRQGFQLISEFIPLAEIDFCKFFYTQSSELAWIFWKVRFLYAPFLVLFLNLQLGAHLKGI